MGFHVFGLDGQSSLELLHSQAQEAVAFRLISVLLLGTIKQSAGQLIDHHVIETEIELPLVQLILGIEDLFEIGDGLVEPPVLSVD